MKTEPTTRLPASPPLSSSDLLGCSIDHHFLDWLFEQGLNASGIRLILAIKRFEEFHADFPTQGEIGTYVGIGAKKVNRGLRRLLAKGVIRRERATKWTWRYEVNAKPNTLLSDRRGAGSLEQIVGASGQNHPKPQ
jgi:hypothetical protein